MPKDLRLPDSELQILEILWERGASTVREIREILARKRGESLAHSTIMTLLQRLESKGHIQKTNDRVGKAFIFEAKLKPERAQKHFLKKYLSRFFGSDPVPLFSWLIESEDLSLDEIVQIRALLEEREQRKRGDEK